jgi:endonuclease-8
MPEGDTVWLAGRRLDQALSGRRLLRTDFRVPQLAATDLTGRTVLGVASRGKHLLTRIEGGLTLHTHFKMEGSWQIYRPGQRWRVLEHQRHQIRVVLANPEAVCVGVRLAVVELLPSAQEHEAVGHLGPDLLADDWGPDAELEALQRLSREPDREIGSALLDQRNLAGLGNLWRCEVLFLRGINPYRHVAAVTDLPRLIELSHRLLLANRARAGQTATGDLRGGARGASHHVYARQGLPCRRCHAPIRRASQGEPGYARETYWCPRCQPA